MPNTKIYHLSWYFTIIVSSSLLPILKDFLYCVLFLVLRLIFHRKKVLHTHLPVHPIGNWFIAFIMIQNIIIFNDSTTLQQHMIYWKFDRIVANLLILLIVIWSNRFAVRTLWIPISKEKWFTFICQHY